MAMEVLALLLVFPATAAPESPSDLAPSARSEASASAPVTGRPDRPAALGSASSSPLLDRHYRAPGWSGAPADADADRELVAQRFQVIAAVAPRPGMRIADFGVGQGLITALFARAVGPDGVVYGVGSAPDLPDVLKELARQYHVTNLVPIASTGDDAALPRAAIDLAFVGGGLGQFTDPRALLAVIHRALVPYGTLIVIAPRSGPEHGRRTGGWHSPNRDTLLAMARQAGFRLIDETPVLKASALLRLERIGDETTPDPAAPAPEDTAGPPPDQRADARH